MEIVLKNVSYQKYLKDININFSSGLIYGLTGKNSDVLFHVIGSEIPNYKGDIIADKKVTSTIISSFDTLFYTNTVKDEFKFIAKVNNYKNNNIKQSVIEMFYKLDIDEGLFNREIYSLSRSEKYLIKIILGLFIDPDIIIFDHIFDFLDIKYRKKLKLLLKNLKKDKVIIINDDANVLYDIVDYIYIMKNSKIVLYGNINDVYQDVEKLENLKIEIPDLCNITYKAKKIKNIKLFYRKDVRDTMKDIYRNV